MTLDTHSEQHRHRCEVRYCLTKGSEWFKTYIAGVAQARGKDAANRLYDDVRQQARLGNDGHHGTWLEPPDVDNRKTPPTLSRHTWATGAHASPP